MIDLKISDIRTFLPSKDFAQSKAFYVALGWKIQYTDANLALLENNNQRFYIQNYHVADWADNCMLHVSVADAEHCYQQLRAVVEDPQFAGARVAQPKPEPYGALVTYVWDPSGVLLHLAQWTNR